MTGLYYGLINQSINQSISFRCVFVCRRILNTHAHTHVIYGSQPDTKSRCRSLSRLIDRYHNFASIFSISKCSYSGPGFNSRSERCIYRASRHSQGTVNGSSVSKMWRGYIENIASDYLV